MWLPEAEKSVDYVAMHGIHTFGPIRRIRSDIMTCINIIIIYRTINFEDPCCTLIVESSVALLQGYVYSYTIAILS